MSCQKLISQKSAGSCTGPEQGSILVFYAVTLLIVIAMIGLAMDAGQLYVTRQRAQAAADAAAQAGAMDIYNGTSKDNGTSSAAWYAQQNGFNTSADSISVSYPSCAAQTWCNGHVTLSSIDNPNLIEVTVKRTVQTTFLRVLGRGPTSVSATADAAIAVAPAPLPMIITHPSNADVLGTGGAKSFVTICGGPSRALQVNSSSATAIGSPNVDLSHAGPGSDGSCTDAVTGADFGIVGGPAVKPSSINLGNNGNYVQPDSAIPDPLASVNPPSIPAAAPAKTSVSGGTNGCPTGTTCYLYSPGKYPNSDGNLDVKNETALFKPGIYYIASGGFTDDANGVMLMAAGFTDGASGTNTGWTGNMMVYNTGGGTFSFAANSTATLVGSPGSSIYEGILFFEDRTAAAATHSFSGGGSTLLTGTVYITNTLAIMQANPSQYQTLSLGGNSSSATQIVGEVITSAISMNGRASILMRLTGTPTQNVRQVALVR